MSYWFFTDIFEENGPRMTPFYGGFGLLNYQGIRKPAYFAFEFLNPLGPEELANADDSSWICRDAAGRIQALLWDFTPVGPPADVHLDMGAPDQLTRAQAEALRQGASGAPVQQVALKHTGGMFTREIALRENDVVLVVLRNL
jgi:xylan 1,4-beta-xylosidase